MLTRVGRKWKSVRLQCAHAAPPKKTRWIMLSGNGQLLCLANHLHLMYSSSPGFHSIWLMTSESLKYTHGDRFSRESAKKWQYMGVLWVEVCVWVRLVWSIFRVNCVACCSERTLYKQGFGRLTESLHMMWTLSVVMCCDNYKWLMMMSIPRSVVCHKETL